MPVPTDRWIRTTAADIPAHVEFIKPNVAMNPTSISVAGRPAGGFTSQVIAVALCAV